MSVLIIQLQTFLVTYRSVPTVCIKDKLIKASHVVLSEGKTTVIRCHFAMLSSRYDIYCMAKCIIIPDIKFYTKQNIFSSNINDIMMDGHFSV